MDQYVGTCQCALYHDVELKGELRHPRNTALLRTSYVVLCSLSYNNQGEQEWLQSTILASGFAPHGDHSRRIPPSPPPEQIDDMSGRPIGIKGLSTRHILQDFVMHMFAQEIANSLCLVYVARRPVTMRASSLFQVPKS